MQIHTWLAGFFCLSKFTAGSTLSKLGSLFGRGLLLVLWVLLFLLMLPTSEQRQATLLQAGCCEGQVPETGDRGVEPLLVTVLGEDAGQKWLQELQPGEVRTLCRGDTKFSTLH